MLSPRHSSVSIGPMISSARSRPSMLQCRSETMPSFNGGLGGSRQRQVERRRAAQLAAVALVVERPGAMHGAAIVPDHEIMRPPDVAIEELRLRGMNGQ